MTSLMKEINVIFPFIYHHQGLSSRSGRIISHVLQLYTISSSLLKPSTLQLNIITFASISSLSQIQMDSSKLIIAHQMIR
jgi:hypothetical protein